MKPLTHLLLASTFLAAAIPFGATAEEPLVLVRRLVDSRYFLPDSAAKLDAVVNQGLRRTADLPPGSNLDSLILSEYKFGKKNSVAAYNKILGAILQQNGITDDQHVTQRKLIIPDLPPMGLTQFNPNKPANSIPKLSITSTKADARSGLTFDFALGATTAKPVVSDDGRAGARFVEQLRWLPLSVAKKVQANASAAAPTLVDGTPWTLSLLDNTSATPVPAGDSILTAQDITSLKAAFGRVAKQRPILVVLDDSWPTDDDFVRARDFFEHGLAEVRKTKRWDLGAPAFSPAFHNATHTSYPTDPVNTTKPLQLHSSEIRQSLQPLQALDTQPGGLVTVIYLPLFRAQTFAEELLTELVHFDLLVHMPGSSLADGISSDQVARKREAAVELVKGASSQIGGGLLQSSQTIVEAALWFGQEYAQESGRPVFFSFSWITKEDDLRVEPPSDLYGYVLAAAGNEPPPHWTAQQCDTLDQNTAYDFGRQLVMRSLDPGDVIGVMNVDHDGGPDCNSSVLRLHHDAVALAYAGRVAGGACGTSFATPRVAWLVASREALRAPSAAITDPDPKLRRHAVLDWRLALRDEIRGNRDPAQCAYNRIRFQPHSFFSTLN